MSRKDTIIIAVLINAGLLIVLFATALKPSDSKEEEFVTPPAPVAAVSEVPMGGQLQAPQDEVDQVLRQFLSRKLRPSLLPPPVSRKISMLLLPFLDRNSDASCRSRRCPFCTRTTC